MLMKYRQQLEDERQDAELEIQDVTKLHTTEVEGLKKILKESEIKWKIELEQTREEVAQVITQSDFLKIKAELEKEIKVLRGELSEAKIKDQSAIEKRLIEYEELIGKLQQDLREKDRTNYQSPRLEKIYNNFFYYNQDLISFWFLFQ